MPRVGQSRRRDANEQAIVDALMAVGAVVFRLSAPGCPDLLVGFRGVWRPMEVKSATGTLTPLQWGSWGNNPYPIVRTVEDALAAIGATASMRETTGGGIGTSDKRGSTTDETSTG